MHAKRRPDRASGTGSSRQRGSTGKGPEAGISLVCGVGVDRVGWREQGGWGAGRAQQDSSVPHPSILQDEPSWYSPAGDTGRHFCWALSTTHQPPPNTEDSSTPCSRNQHPQATGWTPGLSMCPPKPGGSSSLNEFSAYGRGTAAGASGDSKTDHPTWKRCLFHSARGQRGRQLLLLPPPPGHGRQELQFCSGSHLLHLQGNRPLRPEGPSHFQGLGAEPPRKHLLSCRGLCPC